MNEQEKDKLINELSNKLATAQAIITDLEDKIGVLSMFAVAKRCRSCSHWYPSGYTCSCGRDNSYSDADWEKLQNLKKDKK